jgi:hypothetical protein|tara:strand:+ start:3030 stop:3224 length:195 start_codon:yes stop_codon:yes gene_type:complete
MTEPIIVEELKTKDQIELEKTIESCEWDIKYHTEERNRHIRALDIRNRALEDLKDEYHRKYGEA